MQASLHHAREKDTVNVKKKTAATFAVFWIFCGIIDAGFLNAHLQNGFPEFCNSAEPDSQQVFSLGWGVFTGPLGLIYTLFFTSFYNDGWTLVGAQHCGRQNEPIPSSNTNSLNRRNFLVSKIELCKTLPSYATPSHRRMEPC